METQNEVLPSTNVPAPITPGWKTSEFWLSLLAIVLGAVMASGIIPQASVWDRIAGIICSILGALGYTVNRTMLKSTAMKMLVLFCGIVIVLSLTGCPNPTPPQRQAIQCAKDMGTSVLTHAPEIMQAVSAQDWFGALETLVKSIGPGVLCEAQTLMDFLSGKPVSDAVANRATSVLGGGGPQYVGMARLEAWLRVHQADFK